MKLLVHEPGSVVGVGPMRIEARVLKLEWDDGGGVRYLCGWWDRQNYQQAWLSPSDLTGDRETALPVIRSSRQIDPALRFEMKRARLVKLGRQQGLSDDEIETVIKQELGNKPTAEPVAKPAPDTANHKPQTIGVTKGHTIKF